jgi:hypothetical protein
VLPPPVIVDTDALYDLPRLHAPAIVLKEDRRRSSSIPIKITRGAHRRWPYARVFLRFRIRIAPSTRKGFGYVDFDTGSGTSASAEFRTSRRHGHVVTEWDTVNVAGERDHTTRRRVIDVAFSNYMLYRDARAGVHRLRFRLEEYHAFHVRSVSISRRSGLQLTKRSPYPLSVSASTATDRAPRPTEALSIAVTVRNHGRRTAEGLAVSTGLDSGLRLVGGAARGRLPPLAGGQAITRHVRVAPVASGPHTVNLNAVSSVGGATARVRFVSPAPQSAPAIHAPGGPPYALFVAGLLGAASVGGLARRRWARR